MKTVIKIVGVGERKAGVSKNGKSYDLVNVAYTYEDKYIEGYNANSQTINGEWLDEYSIHVGSEHEVVLGYRNYRPYVICII